MKGSSSILSAAVSGILLGLPATANASSVNSRPVPGFDTPTASPLGDTSDAGAKHACKGQNSCKGKGGCKAGDNGCKGKNSCKGKGGCATDGSKPPSA